jgi:transcriptional regulator with XRE-family HTH domain
MNEDILKKFGSRIKNLRSQHGYSQEKLAEISGFHRTYIGMVERGERNISLINISRMADCFNLTIEDLFNNI